MSDQIVKTEQNHSVAETTRYVLGVEYNGSLFSGYQMQSHGTRTVQEELEKCQSIFLQVQSK